MSRKDMPREHSGEVPENTSEPEKNNEEGFLGKYCRMIGGKLMCRIGMHNLVEEKKTSHPCGETTVSLRCAHAGCNKTGEIILDKEGKLIH